MTQTLDQQMVKRFVDCVQSHEPAPIYTAPVSLGLDCPSVMDGKVTHFMYSKGGKLWVGWVNKSPSVQYLFDAFGN